MTGPRLTSSFDKLRTPPLRFSVALVLFQFVALNCKFGLSFWSPDRAALGLFLVDTPACGWVAVEAGRHGRQRHANKVQRRKAGARKTKATTLPH